MHAFCLCCDVFRRAVPEAESGCTSVLALLPKKGAISRWNTEEC